MCSLAMIPLTFCQPGIFFKPMLISTMAAKNVQEKKLESPGSGYGLGGSQA